MIRSIKQRLYLIGLLPLGLLAVSLVAINWYLGVKDARSELRNTRNVTAELLQGPAVDALVVGNSFGFESIASRSLDSSKMITCITLRDATGRVVVSAGRCDRPAEQVELTDVFADANDMSDLPGASQSRLVGELRISLSNAALSEKRRALVIQLCLSLIFIGLVLSTLR